MAALRDARSWQKGCVATSPLALRDSEAIAATHIGAAEIAF